MAIDPEQIAKTSESSHQKALVAWCNVRRYKTDDQRLRLYSVPNGGLRNAKTGATMKAEGASPGVPDLVLPSVIRSWEGHILKPGLYIEMKKPGSQNLKVGGLKPDQIEWRDHLIQQGYDHAVCYTWREAVSVICNYLEIPLEY